MPALLWNPLNEAILEVESEIEDVDCQGFADDNSLLLESNDLTALLKSASKVVAQLVTNMHQKYKISFSAPKASAIIFTTKRDRHTGRDLVFPPIEVQVTGVPEWGNVQIPISDETVLLGITLDRKLTFGPHVNRCVGKAKKLLMALRRCIGAKWGLSWSVIKRIYEGAVVPRLLNGIQCWGDALEKKYIVNRLQSVQRLAALMSTRAFSTARTEVVVALSGSLPIDLRARELFVLSYLHSPLNFRLEDLSTTIGFCPHLRFLNKLLLELGLSSKAKYEIPLLDHKLPYPPDRIKPNVILGKRRDLEAAKQHLHSCHYKLN